MHQTEALHPEHHLYIASGFVLRLQDSGGLSRDALVAARNVLLEQANSSPVLAYAIMQELEDGPQLRLDIDREKALALRELVQTRATRCSAQ